LPTPKHRVSAIRIARLCDGEHKELPRTSQRGASHSSRT
jgi:hypothetical protein